MFTTLTTSSLVNGEERLSGCSLLSVGRLILSKNVWIYLGGLEGKRRLSLLSCIMRSSTYENCSAMSAGFFFFFT